MEFEDGLIDFVYGLLFFPLGFLCWSLFSANGMRWYLKILTLNRDVTLVGILLVFGSLILVVAGTRRLVEKCRRDFLWRDLGFVKSLNNQVPWRIQLVATFVAVILILVGFGLSRIGLIGHEKRWWF